MTEQLLPHATQRLVAPLAVVWSRSPSVAPLLRGVCWRRVTTGACEEQLRRALAGDKRSLRSSLLFGHRITQRAEVGAWAHCSAMLVNRTTTAIRVKHVLHDLEWSRALSCHPSWHHRDGARHC